MSKSSNALSSKSIVLLIVSVFLVGTIAHPEIMDNAIIVSQFAAVLMLVLIIGVGQSARVISYIIGGYSSF